MRGNNYFSMLLIALGLLCMMTGVSALLCFAAVGLTASILGVEDGWLQFLMAAPLTIMLVVYWMFKRWNYFKGLITGRTD
ncbi:hypothetical protein LOY64_03795 [Pseudomonas corrugata]|uniref:Uncharacterized protein n=1 Tax=Pseudomonas corrugata TaxID=47879 RepID=A0A8B6UT09_9PSED|nr:hypothetical protein [Pseudomonas corrugata]MDU9026259.1 hypothetical protein [Pseudomonas corrugata]QTH15036.1 hypothetical protein C4C32_03765 [Pseudomonas corrugata]UZD96143.1 hypothetical protein LOY64_03795 [Pseudomonas corrugata]